MTYEIDPKPTRSKAVSSSYEGEQLIFNKDEPSAAAKSFVSTTVHDAIVECAQKIEDSIPTNIPSDKKYVHFQHWTPEYIPGGQVKRGSTGAWAGRPLTKIVTPNVDLPEVSGVKPKICAVPDGNHIFCLPGPAKYRVKIDALHQGAQGTIRLDKLSIDDMSNIPAYIASNSINLTGSSYYAQVVSADMKHICIPDTGVYRNPTSGSKNVVIIDTNYAIFGSDISSYWGTTGKAYDSSTADASFTKYCIYFKDKYPIGDPNAMSVFGLKSDPTTHQLFVKAGMKGSTSSSINTAMDGIVSNETVLVGTDGGYNIIKAKFAIQMRDEQTTQATARAFYWQRVTNSFDPAATTLTPHGLSEGDIIYVLDSPDKSIYEYSPATVHTGNIAGFTARPNKFWFFDNRKPSGSYKDPNWIIYRPIDTVFGSSVKSKGGSTATITMEATVDASVAGENWFALYQYFSKTSSLTTLVDYIAAYYAAVLGITTNAKKGIDLGVPDPGGCPNIYCNVVCERLT